MKISRLFVKLWPLLALVFGLLIYLVGCLVDFMILAIFGALVVLCGIIAFAERKWAKE